MDVDETSPDGDRSRAVSTEWNPSARRILEWFLLRGNRMSVAVVLLVAVLVVVMGLSIVRPADFRTLLTDTNTVQTLFSALLSGGILLVTIVVSINSIVLSGELSNIENQQQRINATVQYRSRIEEFIEADVSPARPGEFLRAILTVIEKQARAIDTIAHRHDIDEFREEADMFADTVTDATDRTTSMLVNSEYGTFDVLLAGLDYGYEWQLHSARRFKRTYGSQLSEEEAAAIDDLVDTLKVFATGREYFKSLYYKREFARLSSRLLYVTLPIIVYTSYVLLALDVNLFPKMWLLWEPLNITPLTLFISLSYTIALGPYLLLTAYVIRAMTVTQKTLAAGPFILQESKPDEMIAEEGDNDVTVTMDEKQYAND